MLFDQLPSSNLTTLSEKTSAVLAFLDSNGEIGSLEEPKLYVRGKIPLRWGRFGSPELNCVFFGGTTGTMFVGLGGSYHNVLGASKATARPDSVSATQELVGILLAERLGRPQCMIPDAVKDAIESMEGALPEWMEFVAVVIQHFVEFRVLLGSPLFVAKCSEPDMFEGSERTGVHASEAKKPKVGQGVP